MEPLRAERCWKCHRKINPLGEPFEMFDDWGRYRKDHYFDENGNIYTRRDGEFDRKLGVVVGGGYCDECGTVTELDVTQR